MTDLKPSSPFLLCVAALPDCIREACRHWHEGCCTWKPAERQRLTQGARLRLGRA